jgi:FixJ family two-component response regulator
MNRTVPTAFVVDEDPAARRVLTAWLGGAGLGVRDFASGNEFLADRDPKTGGCLVLGTAAPGGDLQLLYGSQTGGAVELPIIQLVEPNDLAGLVRALWHGAADAIEKPFTDRVLVASVRRVLNCPPRPRPAEPSLAESASRLTQLSDRERELLGWILAGRTNKDVARHFGISRRTADFHRANILRKAQARSVAELVSGVMAASPPREAVHAGVEPLRKWQSWPARAEPI